MSGGRPPKRIVFGNLELAVQRGRGGKEKEWTDYVQSDIRAFGIRPCLNVFTESVHKICRQNLSKIKLCDWPNKLDATSWQV